MFFLKKLSKKRNTLSLKDGCKENADGVLFLESLPYIAEIIRLDLISNHHDKSLAGQVWDEENSMLITWKYSWLLLKRDIKI